MLRVASIIALLLLVISDVRADPAPTTSSAFKETETEPRFRVKMVRDKEEALKAVGPTAAEAPMYFSHFTFPFVVLHSPCSFR